MNHNTLEHINKAAYIVLVVLAAIAIVVAMVTGPLGLDAVSITASACAGIICICILLRTVRAMRSPNSRK